MVLGSPRNLSLCNKLPSKHRWHQLAPQISGIAALNRGSNILLKPRFEMEPKHTQRAVHYCSDTPSNRLTLQGFHILLLRRLWGPSPQSTDPKKIQNHGSTCFNSISWDFPGFFLPIKLAHIGKLVAIPPQWIPGCRSTNRSKSLKSNSSERSLALAKSREQPSGIAWKFEDNLMATRPGKHTKNYWKWP